MACEHVDPIIVKQCTILCLFFLFLASTQRGCMHHHCNIVTEVFDWFKFEESLDKDLFCNVHRMDKASVRKLVSDKQPNLRKKCKRPDKSRLSYECVASITLSYLGGAHICDLRVLHRPITKKVMHSYIWNVADAINETCKFQFPLGNASLMNVEAGFRSKSRPQVLIGCLGAIDGMHFPMKNPGNAMHNPNRFCVQRKAKFALLHLACCDSNRKFAFFYCSKCSKSHDSLAFSGTKVSIFAQSDF